MKTILSLLAILMLPYMVLADTQISIGFDMKAINAIDGTLTFKAGNSTINTDIKALQGSEITKLADFNITVPFTWSVDLDTVNNKILRLKGESTLNSARYTEAVYDDNYLAVSDSSVISITAEAVEAKLTPEIKLKQYANNYTAEVALDSNGDHALQEFEKSKITVKPKGDILQVDSIPAFASALPVADFEVNVSEEKAQIVSMVGTYDFSRNVALGAKTYMDESKVSESILGIEYRVGKIVTKLPNDVFFRAKGNISDARSKFVEISIKSNKTIIIGNQTGMLLVTAIDNQTRSPLKDVQLSVFDEEALVGRNATNLNGLAFFNLTPSKYEIKGEKEGYFPAKSSAIVGFKATKTTIELERMPTFSEKLSNAVSSALKNPLLVGLAIVIIAITAFVMLRRR